MVHVMWMQQFFVILSSFLTALADETICRSDREAGSEFVACLRGHASRSASKSSSNGNRCQQPVISFGYARKSSLSECSFRGGNFSTVVCPCHGTNVGCIDAALNHLNAFKSSVCQTELKEHLRKERDVMMEKKIPDTSTTLATTEVSRDSSTLSKSLIDTSTTRSKKTTTNAKEASTPTARTTLPLTTASRTDATTPTSAKAVTAVTDRTTLTSTNAPTTATDAATLTSTAALTTPTSTSTITVTTTTTDATTPTSTAALTTPTSTSTTTVTTTTTDATTLTSTAALTTPLSTSSTTTAPSTTTTMTTTPTTLLSTTAPTTPTSTSTTTIATTTTTPSTTTITTITPTATAATTTATITATGTGKATTLAVNSSSTTVTIQPSYVEPSSSSSKIVSLSELPDTTSSSETLKSTTELTTTETLKSTTELTTTTTEETEFVSPTIANRTFVYRSNKQKIMKKASLRLLVLNTCMLFVLSFQLMFIRLLRKACRQNYENGVRDYIKMQKRQQERRLLRITGSKEISSGKNQGKGSADGAKPRVTLSKGPALKKSSQKTTGKGEQQGKKQQLSPFRWKSPLAKSSIANDVTDFYVVDKKSKAGDKRSRKHGAASIDARQAGEEKQSSDVFFEIARPKGDAGAKTDGFFALPRTRTQKSKSARRNDNMAALHHDKAQTNHKIAGNTDDFFAIPRNAKQSGEKEQKMGDFFSLPRNVRQKSGKASKSDDMVALPHDKAKKSTVLKKSEDLVTKPLTAKKRSEQAKKINDIGAKAAQAKQKDGRVKK